jgi:hypothetical protein
LKIEGSEIIKFAYSPLPFETLLEAAKERKTHQMHFASELQTNVGFAYMSY